MENFHCPAKKNRAGKSNKGILDLFFLIAISQDKKVRSRQI